MKKQIFLSAVALFSASTLFFTGCKKDDTSNPTLALKGNSPMTISLNTTTADPGATATDDQDGDISSKITSDWSATNPNVNLKGTYTITYTVADAAGNPATEKRTVSVVNDAEIYAGVYANSKDTCIKTPPSAFTATVTTSDKVNNRIIIANFGAFDETVNVNADISGTTLTVPIAQSLGGTAYIQTVYPVGTAVVSATAPTKFRIKYQWNDGTASDVCQSWYIR